MQTIKLANGFEVVEVPVLELKNWEENPREILDENYLVEVLKNRGQLVPLLIDGRDMKTVLGGNMRLKIMTEVLKWEKAVCSIAYPKDDRDAALLALENNNQFGKYVQEKTLSLLEKYSITEAGLKIDLNPISITSLRPLESDNLSDKNKEIDPNSFSETYPVTLKFAEMDYEEYLSLIAVMQEKLGTSSNEQTILELLRNGS